MHVVRVWGFSSLRSTLVQQLFTVRTLRQYAITADTHTHKNSCVVLTYCFWHCSNIVTCQCATVQPIITMHHNKKSTHTCTTAPVRQTFITPPAPPIHQCDLTWVISSETGQVTDIKPLEYQYLQSPLYFHLNVSTKVTKNRHQRQTPVASEISYS